MLENYPNIVFRGKYRMVFKSSIPTYFDIIIIRMHLEKISYIALSHHLCVRFNTSVNTSAEDPLHLNERQGCVDALSCRSVEGYRHFILIKTDNQRHSQYVFD
uniref:Uncharacterized protein n=1 Tax=Cacopsylla melanoneura TaxID=428564 RepID=A0A8D9BQF4_9HEMI